MGLIKLLQTIRFDGTDAYVFDPAAPQGDWALTGATAFIQTAPDDLVGKTRQAFANGFFAVPSFGFSTFATVAEATPDDADAIVGHLAAHYLEALGAPDSDTATAAARADVEAVIELCADVPINTVFTMRRVLNAHGEIEEELRQIKPPSGEPIHTKIWEIEADDS
jgi:hypothetical protein